MWKFSLCVQVMGSDWMKVIKAKHVYIDSNWLKLCCMEENKFIHDVSHTIIHIIIISSNIENLPCAIWGEKDGVNFMNKEKKKKEEGNMNNLFQLSRNV